MHKMNPLKFGLVVGTFFGLMHLMWALMVYFKVAQRFLEWVFSLHSLQINFVVTDFVLSKAITLILFTTLIGIVFGTLFVYIWRLFKGSEESKK